MARYGSNIVQNALLTQQAAMEGVDSVFRDRARLRAGNALAAGDSAEAANLLYRGGMLDEGYQTRQRGQEEQDRQAKARAAQAYAKRDYAGARDAYAGIGDIAAVGAVDEAETAKRAEDLKFTLQATQTLKRVLATRGGQDTVAAFDKIAPTFEQMGVPAEQLRQYREQLAADPQGFLDTVEAIAGQEAEKLRFEKAGDEVLVFGERTGDLRGRYGPSRYKLGAGDSVVETGGPAALSGTSDSGAGSADDVFGALIMQESGGRPGVLGPMTEYGQAQGMTQMLPATAQEMAQKLGVAWRPELMTGTSPEAAQYQQALGRAYFEQGLTKYGGDIEKALMYYHGGPDEAKWGPKTQQYARDVLGRLQSAQTAGPAAPTGRVIARGEPKPVKRVVDATAAELRSAGYPAGTRAQKDESGQFVNIKQPTEGQIQAAGFAHRVFGANDALNALADRKIYKPTAQTLISERNGVTRIIASKPEDRQFIQAAKNWLAPILRKDTGAAVTDAELVTYMDIYIPRPEDDFGTLKQKAEARQQAMKALVGTSAGLYVAQYGDRKFVSKYPEAAKPGKAQSGARGMSDEQLKKALGL